MSKSSSLAAPESSPQSAKCPNGCGSWLVFTTDAIGRVRERCPSCDGVSHRPRLHPDGAPRPQTLLLARPAVGKPCQHCGQFVRVRYRTVKPCLDCGVAVTANRKRCPECVAKKHRQHKLAYYHQRKAERLKNGANGVCVGCGGTIRRVPGTRGRLPERCPSCRMAHIRAMALASYHRQRAKQRNGGSA